MGSQRLGNYALAWLNLTKRYPTCCRCNGQHLGPVVRDAVWEVIQPGGSYGNLSRTRMYLCKTCMERALGRNLTYSDLEPGLPWNRWRAAYFGEK